MNSSLNLPFFHYSKNEDLNSYVMTILRVIQEPLEQPYKQCFVYDNVMTVNHGIFWLNPSLIVSLRYSFSWEVICFNLETRSILFQLTMDSVFGITSSIDVTTVQHNTVLDLTIDGERWEGDVLEGEPYGYGQLYNEDNHLSYCGFLMGKDKVGYGIEYYTDSNEEIIMYEGNYWNGLRHGTGYLGYRNGFHEVAGLWIDGSPVLGKIETKMTEHSNHLTLSLTSLVISGISDFGMNSFPFIQFKCLEELRVEENCFQDVTQFILHDLPVLRYVEIGEQSFSQWDNAWNEIVDRVRTFSIKSCPSLDYVYLHDSAFSDYFHFSIVDVPLLRELLIGEDNGMSDCFTNCPILHLRGLPSLERLRLGGQCFFGVEDLLIESTA